MLRYIFKKFGMFPIFVLMAIMSLCFMICDYDDSSEFKTSIVIFLISVLGAVASFFIQRYIDKIKQELEEEERAKKQAEEERKAKSDPKRYAVKPAPLISL